MSGTNTTTKRLSQVALFLFHPFGFSSGPFRIKAWLLLALTLHSSSVLGFQEPQQKRTRSRDSVLTPVAGKSLSWPGNIQITMEPIKADSLHPGLAKVDTVGSDSKFLQKLFAGYITTPYIDFDLKYLVKFNEYEAFRLGMGITTNENLSERFRVKSYAVYGTRDQDLKYGFSTSYNLHQERASWVGFDYTDDLVETGSEKFISEGRQFYLFEPRLFNINLFHRTRSITAWYSRNLTSLMNSRLQLSLIDVEPTYAYSYVLDNKTYSKYQTSTATLAVSWQPFSTLTTNAEGKSVLIYGYPMFDFQAIQSFQGVFKSDFNFTKFQFRVQQQWNLPSGNTLQLRAQAFLALGELPLTELFHAYPNQPNRSPLMSRFSVAGIDSFETMYYNEFFSDQLFTLQAKHFFPAWKISKLVEPQLVLISRYAVGDTRHPERHQQLTFNTLEKGFFESGMELNGIFAGFGLNFMYRYGPYHLSGFENNVSFKFTFYLKSGS